MIPFEQALRIVLESARLMPSERVDMADSLGRILADDVKSDSDMPPFDKSAMDGFACRQADLGNPLAVLETIQAGRAPTRRIGRNECSKIMTGAAVPDGADCVIMIEHTEPCGAGLIRFTGRQAQANICARGEDVRRGDVVLERGTRILDRHIAVLAAVGSARPLVAVRPRVGIMATGDELVEPSSVPGPFQIRNSNAWQLMAQVSRAGCLPFYLGIAADREADLSARVKKAAAEHDVILLSGGVSAGEFDLVPGVLRANGFELLFEKVAVQPGMPTVFGRSGTCYCFGLPGNPVSTFVLFEILVKQFLFKLMGHEYRAPGVQMRMGRAARRKRSDRASWIPVAVSGPGVVVPVEYHGSAHINSLCGAHGLVCIPVGTMELQEGATVDVRQL